MESRSSLCSCHIHHWPPFEQCLHVYRRMITCRPASRLSWIWTNLSVSFQCEAVLRSLLLEDKREDVKKSEAMLSAPSIQSQHSSALSGRPSSPPVTRHHLCLRRSFYWKSVVVSVRLFRFFFFFSKTLVPSEALDLCSYVTEQHAECNYFPQNILWYPSLLFLSYFNQVACL